MVEVFPVKHGSDSHQPCEGSDSEEDRGDCVPLVDGGNSIEKRHTCSIACAHDDGITVISAFERR